MRARVVGAGVIGLSCAVRLREAGVDAHVVADAHGPATTSAVAAALWYPYHAGPANKVRAWGRTTFHELCRLADDPATGVLLRPGVQHLRVAVEPPDWAADVPGFRVTGDGRDAGTGRDGGRPPGAGPYVGAWTFDSPVADSVAYLGWLTARLAELGGTVSTGHVPSVDAALDGVDRAVLATGLGARTLPGDDELVGGRGQVVLVRAPAVRRWVLDNDHPDGMVYVVPRRHDVVCGGIDVPSGIPGQAPDPELALAILRRCTEVVPELRGAEIVGHRVGERPVRSSVRLDRVGDVVHCYGHGGAGFTLSWGCAGEVRDLVTEG